ncbi:hypothetical protein HNP55_001774 [Paucibacter oligotrophus]|uniref:Uncharacterized protein n=1 Tax=Roseateles oligotrophus TaxID=1769250 RepID=A0A840L921_9BURK|nr:hypothetical protein [Roseateles oligotrophus]MBB4843255.1 hypothetical protein [Roseateles oligotrophus]
MTTTQNDTALSISVDVLEEGGKTTVVCSPEVLAVSDRNSLIVFNLLNPDYEFPASGAIVFAQGAGEFPNSWYLDPAYVAVRDRRLTTGEYAYTATVQHRQTKEQHSVDPVIKNMNE